MKKIEKFSKSKLVCFEGFVDSYASKEEGKEVNLSGVEFVESNGETSILNVTMPSQIFKILETDYKKQKKLYTVRFKKKPKSTPDYYAYAIDDGTLSHDVSELEDTIKAKLTGFFTRSFLHLMYGAAAAGPIGMPATLVFLGFIVLMIALGIDEDLVGPFLAIYAAWPVFSLLDLFFGKRHVPTYRLAMEELKALGAERLSLINLPKPYGLNIIVIQRWIVIGVFIWFWEFWLNVSTYVFWEIVYLTNGLFGLHRFF